MNITEAGVVNSPSESGTNDNPCFNDTQLKETFLMRRTTATTDYLKECMGTALLELMKEKPIEKISIEEMTAKADVGRSTYFRYFKSKDEVLSFKITCLWKRFSDEHGATNFATGSYDGIRLFFEFCLSTRPICDLLYSADRQYVILNFYLQEAASIVANADAKTHYFIQFITYGLFGLMNAYYEAIKKPHRKWHK
jgi:hypothetical protein